jgi:hypothetical protein
MTRYDGAMRFMAVVAAALALVSCKAQPQRSGKSTTHQSAAREDLKFEMLMNPRSTLRSLGLSDVDIKGVARQLGAPGPNVEAVNYCIRSRDRLSFQALIPITYAKIAAGDRESKQLYQFDCSVSNHWCEGLLLRTSGIEQGKPIGAFDLGRAEGAEVISVTGDVIVIKWGIYRTFTVDLAIGRVTYVESGEGLAGPVEGRGEVACNATK